MRISGLQKLSLVDYPGRVACTVFTGGCNLRCPYCHNSELLEDPPEAMTEEEFLAFLRKRKGMLEGVCVTGGEPCVHRDLPEFLKKIHSLGYPVKLDTNGSFPDMLEAIFADGSVEYAAVDIKNGPQEYSETAGRPFAVENLLRSVEMLMDSGIAFELRTTLAEPLHTPESVMAMRGMLLPLVRKKGKIPAYFLQPFTDRDTVPFAGLQAPSEERLREYLEILAPLAERTEIRGMDM